MRSSFTVKHLSFRFVFNFLLFFSCITLIGQSYQSTPKKATLVIEGKNVAGYEVYIEFPVEQVNKSFWKYAKGFGHLENRKSYYKVTVPPAEQEFSETILYGKPKANGSTTIFGLAPELGDDQENQNVYLEQVKMILLEFKVDTYMKDFQEKINDLTKEASKLSKSHQKLLKKGELYSKKNAATLSRLQSIEKQIGEYRQQQILLISTLEKAKG